MDLFDLLGASSAVRPVAPSFGALSSVVVGESTIEKRITKAMMNVTVGRHDPAAVARIRRVVSKCGEADEFCKMGAGLYDLRAAVRYVLDDDQVDSYAPYMVSVVERIGDCSRMSVAIATHAAVCDIPCGVCTIAQVNHKTGEVGWSHVYGLSWPLLTAHGPRRRVAADVSEKNVPLDWEPQRWRVRMKRDWIYDVAAWDRWYASGSDENSQPTVTWRDIR